MQPALDSHHPTLHHRTAPAVGVPTSWRWPGMALQVCLQVSAGGVRERARECVTASVSICVCASVHLVRRRLCRAS